MIPDSLSEAIAKHKADPSFREKFGVDSFQKDVPEFGDILVANNHLMFAFKIWPNHFNGWLIHTYKECATSSDVIIHSNDTSLLYDIVVQTNVVTNIFIKDIQSYIGECKPSFDFKRISYAEDGAGDGPRLCGPLDSRWNFKDSQGKIAMDISQDVIYHNLHCREIGLECDCLNQ